MKNFLVFTFRDGVLDIHELHQWEDRGTNTAGLLRELYLLAPESLEGRNCIAFYGDNPPTIENTGQFDLVFSSVKVLGETDQILPLPDPYSIGWRQVGNPDPERLMRQFLSNNAPPESGKMFWIGADTHPVRRNLVQCARQQPDILDASIMGWPTRWNGYRHCGRKVSLSDHQKFKYLIDCQGFGYSARLKWLLFMGRPVFVVNREPVEFWHEELVAWKHFVPVKSDMSNLFENFARIESDETLYALISSEAKDFAAEKLFVKDQLKSCGSILKIL